MSPFAFLLLSIIWILPFKLNKTVQFYHVFTCKQSQLPALTQGPLYHVLLEQPLKKRKPIIMNVIVKGLKTVLSCFDLEIF